MDGLVGILSAFFILFFYCALGGYCIKYTVLNIGDLFHASFGANALGSTGFAPGNLLGMTGDLPTWAADWLDFFDMLSEGIMMPLGALLMSLMIGWELGPDMVKNECEASGHAMSGYGFFKVCVKFITPLIMVLVLYGQIKSFF